MKHLAKIVFAVVFVSSLLFAGASQKALAAYDPFNPNGQDLCQQAGDNAGGSVNDQPSACTAPKTNPVSGNDSLIMKAINIVTIVAGVIAVVMLMIAGTQMILSTGDSAKFTKSRTTLIYIVVGIVIILLARTIIAFIVNRIS